MLTDEEMEVLFHKRWEKADHESVTRYADWRGGFHAARALVDAKITNGELMVVKTASLVWQSDLPNDLGLKCSACGAWTGGRDGRLLRVGEFCRCGAKII